VLKLSGNPTTINMCRRTEYRRREATEVTRTIHRYRHFWARSIMDEMQVYIFIRSRSSKNRLLNTQRYRLVRVCAVSRDMVYIYITAWNERTDGNSMGLTTYAIMYNQRVIIYVAKCEPARELGT